MFVGNIWERNRGEFVGFELMYSGCIDGYGFFGGYIWFIFYMVVLFFLFSFELEMGKVVDVFFGDGFVYGGIFFDVFFVVVSN